MRRTAGHDRAVAPTPELQRRLLAPPGKDCWVAFALCGECLALPDVLDRVNAAMVFLADQSSGHVGVN